MVERDEDPRRTRQTATGTVDELIGEFAARHLVKLKPVSAASYLHSLRGRFLKRFSGRKPADIRRGEIRALLDDIFDEGRRTTANRTLAAVRKFFNWAVERGELDFSPCQGLKAPAKEIQRSRFLTMDEVALVWTATAALSPVNKAYVRILLLTGQRRSSVANMRRSQIVRGVWTIPCENMKGGRLHSVPFSGLAQRVIDDVPRMGDGELVFTHDGISPAAAYSQMKDKLDGAIHDLMHHRGGVSSGIAEWRLHDLRRTVGTHIARISFPRLLVSKILGHVEGGVTQIYELYSYDDEKRRALDGWADEIEKALMLANDSSAPTRSAPDRSKVLFAGAVG